MRITGRLAGGASVAALTLVLTAACGGGATAGPATSASDGSTSSAVATTPAAPVNVGLPAQPVCDVFSKDTISKVIGMPIYSANDVDFLAGPQPTTCFYYTDTRQVDSVEIHWMTLAQAPWDQQIASIGTVDSGGMKTVIVRYPGLGDDAIKGVGTTDVATTSTYMVLLKNKGVVLEMNNGSTSTVSDAAFVKLIRTAIQTINEL